jgi:hypothetical protein
LAHVARIEELESLFLTSSKISDSGLEHLARLKKLQFIYLLQSRVTAAGVAKLKQSLPGATIWRD